MNAYDHLRVVSSTLHLGEDRGGEVCPFCNGGRTREATLSIRRVGPLTTLYVCHRASCGRKGRIGPSVAFHDLGSVKAEKPERRFTGEISDVPEEVRSKFIEDYGIDLAATSSVGWNVDAQKTVWGIRGPDGALRGYELRRYRGDAGPKTDHFRHDREDPWCGWYFPNQLSLGRRIIAVEDPVSALKVSKQYPCCSLMGSHIDLDRLVELVEVALDDPILVCLDRDATDKANKLAKRYAMLAPNMIAVPLQVDMKYMTHDEIHQLVNEYG